MVLTFSLDNRSQVVNSDGSCDVGGNSVDLTPGFPLVFSKLRLTLGILTYVLSCSYEWGISANSNLTLEMLEDGIAVLDIMRECFDVIVVLRVKVYMDKLRGVAFGCGFVCSKFGVMHGVVLFYHIFDFY